MCGRFALGLPRQNIVQAVRQAHPELDLGDEWVDDEAFHPRYNVAPRSRSAVIRHRNGYEDGVAESQPGNYALIHTMKWGLIPHWSKHEDKSLNTINAKAENLVEGGGMWGSIKGRKRCAVLCQGYYEWLKKGKERIPHFTKHKDGKLMVLAGLYDSVTLEGEAKPLWTFTIVTTDASKQLSWLHDRMPVILSTQKQLDTWLDTSSQAWSAELSKILLPYSNKESQLECYAVPTDVGKVGAESATFVEPVAKRKDGIQAMFAKQTKNKKGTDSEQPKASKSIPTLMSPSVSPAEGELTGPLKRKRESPGLGLELGIELLDGPPDEKKLRTSGNAKGNTVNSGVSEVKDKAERLSGKTMSPNSSEGLSSKSNSQSTKSPHKPPTKLKLNADMPTTPSSSKITSFFTKDK